MLPTNVRQQNGQLLTIVQKIVFVANVLAAVAMGVEAIVRIASVITGIRSENKKRKIGFTANKEKAKIFTCPECKNEILTQPFRYMRVLGKRMPVAYRGYCIHCRKYVQFGKLARDKKDADEA